MSETFLLDFFMLLHKVQQTLQNDVNWVEDNRKEMDNYDCDSKS